MKSAFWLAAAGLAAATAVAPAPAVVIVDYSPGGAYGGTGSNIATGQNFLSQFSITGDTYLTAMEIYTRETFGAPGSAVTIKIRADQSNAPTATNLFTLDEIVSSRTPTDEANPANNAIVRAEFDPLLLYAGTYWIGMSGSSQELGWSFYEMGSTPAHQTRALTGDAVGISITQNFAMRLEGSLVPEPDTWAMLILGFGAVGATMRAARKRAGDARTARPTI